MYLYSKVFILQNLIGLILDDISVSRNCNTYCHTCSFFITFDYDVRFFIGKVGSIIIIIIIIIGRTQWPCGLSRGPAAGSVVEIAVSNPAGAISVSCDYWVLSDRCLCVDMITRPEEYTRV
jgi:hypothetical protein